MSTVKPTECKDLFIRLKVQCLSRPCPAVNAISQAYLDLSAKLNFFFLFFFLTKHPHYSCPSIIYVSKLHSNISSFNSMKGLRKKKKKKNQSVTPWLPFALGCQCAAIVNHSKDLNRLSLTSCYISIKPLHLILNSQGSPQALLDVSKHCGSKSLPSQV